MSTFTIPADVWAHHQPGQPFVAAIVEGECLCGDLGDVIHEFIIHGRRLGPPAWLVAMRDGRLLHDVRVGGATHCGRCDSTLMHDHGTHEWEPWVVRCLVDVVPVIGDDESAPDGCKLFIFRNEHGWILADHRDGTARSHQLTPAHVDALVAACGKPPADWPGMYAVILEVHDV